MGLHNSDGQKAHPQNRADIIVGDKKKRECQIIDVAYPGDSRILPKEEEKTNKYRDLAVEGT